MESLNGLIDAFARLPGIGKKSAARLAYFILNSDKNYTDNLSALIRDIKTKVKFCSICGSFTEEDLCVVCRNPMRDRQIICVLEQPQDVFTIENTLEYRGLYHVLNGVISPLDGIGPDQIRIKELQERIKDNTIKEIILATNPTVEGDTTALYIVNILKNTGIRITRLASGLPVGGDMEYADRQTLSRSLKGRTDFKLN